MSRPRHLHVVPPPDAELSAGRRALARFEWGEARASFEAVLAQADRPEAHEGLATALCWLGDIPGALESWERAFVGYRSGGAERDAARVAIDLALESAGSLGEHAVANGWLRRARRLLQDLEPCPEHAWLALWEGHIAFLLHDDLVTGRERLDEGRTLARELGVHEAELFAEGLEGMALVAEGRVQDGLARLDEAATAAATGELADIQAIGQAYCYMLRACELTFDFDRAGQWLEVAKAGSRKMHIDYRLSYCREHHAAILMWRGAFAEAESELEPATRELAPISPATLPLAFARLGALRLRQGRYDEAADLFARAEASPLATLGRAELALDQGGPEGAIDLVQRYFRRLPEGDRIHRIPGLALDVRARCLIGDLETAERSLSELRAIADDVGTAAIQATASACAGLLAAARGDHETARGHFEEAIGGFSRASSPFEATRARVELGRTLHELDLRTAAMEAFCHAEEAFRAMGAAGELERVASLRSRLADEAEAACDGSPCPEPQGRLHGLTARQLEVLRLVATGLSNREIAGQLYLSEHTVKRHLADILARLDLPTRAAAAAFAVRHELV